MRQPGLVVTSPPDTLHHRVTLLPTAQSSTPEPDIRLIDRRHSLADWRDIGNVQTGVAEDDAGALHAPEVAGDVLRLHHQEQQRRIANRVGITLFNLYHTWCAPVHLLQC